MCAVQILICFSGSRTGEWTLEQESLMGSIFSVACFPYNPHTHHYNSQYRIFETLTPRLRHMVNRRSLLGLGYFYLALYAVVCIMHLT